MRRFEQLISFLLLTVPFTVCAQEIRESTFQPEVRHHVVLFSGLPGDADHEAEFRILTSRAFKLLLATGFQESAIDVLIHGPKREKESVLQINKTAIAEHLEKLRQSLARQDVFWAIFVGHADHDGEHARFHLPGPDLRAVDYADLFDSLPCERQIIVVSTASSGWFIEPLSKPGRIVVTATARDAEPNETEFPRALLRACGEPLDSLDMDEDGSVSLLEVFAKTHEFVQAAYAADQRAVTEHATLDDNGDGKGTEWEEIFAEQQRIAKLGGDWNGKVDGALANQTILTGFSRPPEDSSPDSSANSSPAEQRFDGKQ